MASRSGSDPLARLLACCRTLAFRPHDIGARIDLRRHYELPLDRDFPLSVTGFEFHSSRHTPGWNWHEHLELFLPLDGPIRMRMGETVVALAPGDLLIVDHLKLHNVEDSAPFDTRAVVLSFLPDLVHTPGGPSCDYTFLLPFLASVEGTPRVVRRREPGAGEILQAFAAVLRRSRDGTADALARVGTKAALLELLHRLFRRFGAGGMLRADFAARQRELQRLTRVFEHVRLHYPERTTVAQAAALVGMSETRFMKAFRRTAGMTFVTYVTKVRLTQALRLLGETSASIAEIAIATGFSDQSYFDRRFKHVFGRPPRQYRADLARAAARDGGSAAAGA